MPFRRLQAKQSGLPCKYRISGGKTASQAPFCVAPTIHDHVSSTKESVSLVQVNHPKIPDLPIMGSLRFELLFYAYLLTGLFGQYIFIYKTVWWYPSTLPPSLMTINFHLIDNNLSTLLIIFFSRRLVFTILWKHLKPNSDSITHLFVWILVCLVVMFAWVAEVFQNLILLHDKFNYLKLMFLYYPILFWFPVYWISENGILSYNLDSPPPKKSGWLTEYFYPSSFSRLQEEPESIGDGKTSYANLGNACDAEQVREEVNLLCRDFNSRIAEIVFSSLLCAYYVGLVPIFYTESYQAFDVAWSLQYTALILMNAFSMLYTYLLPPKYLQIVHKCATLLGGYEDVANLSKVQENNHNFIQWSPSRVFPEGAYVWYQKRLYKAIGINNTANPLKSSHKRFYFMFHKPLRMLNLLLGLHVAIVVFQIHLLMWSSSWDQLILPALLQFFSYFVLFTILRDRIVLGKAYSAYQNLPLPS